MVLPAYNAARTLQHTVNKIPRDTVDDIVLTDDASCAGTADLARALGIHTLRHVRNQGYGGNQKTCYARGGTIDLLYAGSGNRYAFVPQVLFALVLLGIAITSKGGIGWLARGGIIWLLAIGIVEFYDDPIRDGFTQGPRWADEVAAWRQDPTHLVRLWPDSDIWKLDLNPPPSTPH